MPSRGSQEVRRSGVSRGSQEVRRPGVSSRLTAGKEIRRRSVLDLTDRDHGQLISKPLVLLLKEP